MTGISGLKTPVEKSHQILLPLNSMSWAFSLARSCWVSWQASCARASSAISRTGPGVTTATVEAPGLPSRAPGVASDPEGFTLATWVDLGRESSSGGLDRQSATTFSLPGTCLMSEVYLAT